MRPGEGVWEEKRSYLILDWRQVFAYFHYIWLLYQKSKILRPWYFKVSYFKDEVEKGVK